jgi:hypothetical protein
VPLVCALRAAAFAGRRPLAGDFAAGVPHRRYARTFWDALGIDAGTVGDSQGRASEQVGRGVCESAGKQETAFQPHPIATVEEKTMFAWHRQLAITALLVLLAGCGNGNGSSRMTSTPTNQTITGPILPTLTVATTIGSTLDPIEHGGNPYGLTVATATAGLITSGDLIVCNFQ